MHTKRGAIFSSQLGRENIVHIILTHIFATPYIFKKPAKNNSDNTRKNCVKLDK